MPLRTPSPPPVVAPTVRSPGASTTAFALPSPSLQEEEGFRMRSITSPKAQSGFPGGAGKKGAAEDYYAGAEKEKELQRSNPSGVLPYIGLRAKLSQAWLAYPIIALFFIATRLLSVVGLIRPLMEDFKRAALRSCDALEVATSTITSLPHFMAGGFNRATVEGVNAALRGIARTVDLAIVVVEAIVVWIIETYSATFRCLLEFVLRGSISAGINAAQFIESFTRNRLTTTEKNINDQIAALNRQLDTVREKVNEGSALIKQDINIPTITIPAADGLSDFTFPEIDQKLAELNSTLPTMAEIEDKLTGLVTTPFEDLRSTVRNVMDNIRFNATALPVPPKNEVTFCDDNLDLSVLDDIANDLVKAAYIGLVLLLVFGLLMIVANALYIWYSHRRFMRNVDRTQKTMALSDTANSRDNTIQILKSAERPLLTYWIVRSSRIFKRSDHRNLYRWFWDYVLHPGALLCLVIGIIGIITVYVQIAMMNGVRNSSRDQLDSVFGEFGDKVVDIVNSKMGETSRAFSRDVNNVISRTEEDVNQDLFGWVNLTTTTLNDTLNVAVDDITSFISETFGPVPVLETAVTQLVNCLVLGKIRAIQAGLTFIKNNAFIGLPRVNETILMVDRSQMDEVVGEATTRFVGSSDGDRLGGEIGSIFDKYEQHLRADLPLFWLLVFCWLAVVVFALVGVVWQIIRGRKRVSPVASLHTSASALDSIPPPPRRLPTGGAPGARKGSREASQESPRPSMLAVARDHLRDRDEQQFDSIRSKLKSLANRKSTTPQRQIPAKRADAVERDLMPTSTPASRSVSQKKPSPVRPPPLPPKPALPERRASLESEAPPSPSNSDREDPADPFGDSAMGDYDFRADPFTSVEEQYLQDDDWRVNGTVSRTSSNNPFNSPFDEK